MWRVQLVCGVCNTAVVSGADPHYRNAAYTAKQAAKLAGWVKATGHSPLWTCAGCLAHLSTFKIGDNLVYTGNVRTAEGFNLHGEHVIIKGMGTDKLIIVFNNPAAGNYHRNPHWFYPHEFAQLLQTTNE